MGAGSTLTRERIRLPLVGGWGEHRRVMGRRVAAFGDPLARLRSLRLLRFVSPSSNGISTGQTVRLFSRRIAVPAARPVRRLHLAVDGAPGEPLQLHVAGELDVATAPQLASQLSTLTEDADALGLDLSRVTFIDLAGLRVIVEARARDRRLHVVAASYACERLLELTGTTHLLRAG